MAWKNDLTSQHERGDNERPGGGGGGRDCRVPVNRAASSVDQMETGWVTRERGHRMSPALARTPRWFCRSVDSGVVDGEQPPAPTCDEVSCDDQCKCQGRRNLAEPTGCAGATRPWQQASADPGHGPPAGQPGRNSHRLAGAKKKKKNAFTCPIDIVQASTHLSDHALHNTRASRS